MQQTSPYEVDVRSANNGTNAVAHEAGPRLPRLYEWADLEPYGYPGFRVKLWVNFPQRLANELNSGDLERAKVAVVQIVAEHNGWCDDEGTPFPPASDSTLWDAIPQHLANAVTRAMAATFGTLPNSPSPSSGRSAPG
jgi:hypothetical protein